MRFSLLGRLREFLLKNGREIMPNNFTVV